MKNKGITLVALVVTIVIMLILAGVTLNIALSDNGLFKKAKQAVGIYQLENEREAIGMSVTSYKLGEYTESQETKLGKNLADRNLENSSIWDIIVEKSDNKEYGTGWNYIEKGTDIEGYGKAKNNWLVNYETGEIIKLEDDTYNNFNYKSSLAIEGAIYNLDSANVGLDKASWGNNATLYYYNAEEYNTIEKRQNAYNKQKDNTVETFGGYDRQISENISEYIDESTGAFKFNGNNYIEIHNPNGFDFTEGLTFEFYGNIEGALPTTRNIKTNEIISIMSFWNGEHNAFADTRFMYIKENELYSFLGSLTSGVHEVLDEYSGWPDESVKRNIKYSTNMKKNEDKFFSLVIDPLDKKFGEEYVGLYLYEDGKEIGNTWVSKKYYNFFLDGTKKIKYIEMGRCPVDYIGNWTYLKGICYAIRIYNKALRDGEVQANYDKTTDFHKYIIDSKKQKNL